MTQPSYDCLCAGIVVADHVCAPVDHLPAAGELVTTDRLELAVGGCASNVAVDLAKLGVKAAVIGCVGQDVFGRFVRESLEQAGVACQHLVEIPSEQTSGTLVVNVQGEDRRFIHTVGANARFSGTEVMPDIIRSSRVLYLGGYLLSENPTADNVATMFEAARAAGVVTVLDVVVPEPADYWPRLRPILQWTDVFVPNDDEARVITGLDDPIQQAEEFRAAGAKTVVITCGADGAVLVNENVRFRGGVDQVEFVDGTGSGDAFVAGYIVGLLNGGDERQCLRSGSALGASSVRATGATTGVFSADALREFIESREFTIESV